MVFFSPKMRLQFILYFVLFDFLLTTAIGQQKLINDAVVCSRDLFKCEKSGKCIPPLWRCDMETDCAFGEDEENCGLQQTMCNEETEYHCSEAAEHQLRGLHGTSSLFLHHCIPKDWLCDGEPDCPNEDDESNCEKIKCNNATHFECKNSLSKFHKPLCISKGWVCDGQSDCMDMSDEENCPDKKCADDEFRCKSDGSCIYKSWRCDGEPDCVDHSDEDDCEEQHNCKDPNMFKCASGDTCIPAKYRCDLKPNCHDYSDELNCDTKLLSKNVAAVTCSNKEFKCHNGVECISSTWMCDGDRDCSDGSDELDCKALRCGQNEQSCADGKSCFGIEAVCDRIADCEDGSDELNCPSNSNTTTTCDLLTEYSCPDSTSHCVKLADLCKVSSADCTISVCNKNITMCDEKDEGCDCRKMGQRGKVCHCKSGLQHNGDKCEDINECENHGICDQICVNKYRSYACDCYPGYILTLGAGAFVGRVPHKCRAVGQDPKLLLSNRATIRQYDIVTNKYHPLISSLESAVALDYWHKNQTLIWSDVSKKQIMICHIGNKTLLNNIGDCLEHGNVTLINDDIQTPDGLAVDWVHGLLFWTDTGFNTISVFDLLTRRRKVLIDKNLDEPRAIAVDPSAGLIFWTDWGVNASIERAGMDGQNRMVIMSGDAVRWPNGLALDILDRRVYWADAKLKTISSCDYWGKNVRKVLQSHRYLRHPFSLAVFEEKLYWTDWDHEGVISVNKFHGNDAKTLVSGMTGPMTVRVYHKQAQPDQPNKCERHSCHHLCLPRAHMQKNSESREVDAMGAPYTCACDQGFEVSTDDETICIPLDAALDLISHEASSSRIPYLYFVLLFGITAVIVLMFTQYRQRNNHFTVLHFDNPIYRRTVEDLDADLENPPDLGAISTLPVTNLQTDPRNGATTKESGESKNNDVKLLLGNSKSVNASSTKSLLEVGVTDSSQYSFGQNQ